MRYLLLALPLVAAGCAYGYDPGYSQGYYGPGYSAPYAYNSGYGTPSYSQRYASNDGYVMPYDGGENCGTPDDPKGCPPLPRHPLPVLSG